MIEYDTEEKILISPATTPGSIDNKNIVITNYYIPQNKKKEKWYNSLRTPHVLLTISILEIAFFLITTEELLRILRFDPRKQIEIWRFVSYMLMHDGWEHLSLNVILQCIFAMFLEASQDGWKVLFVYVSGGIGGALGAACVRPDLLVGASAGVYALLISYISYIILNFQSIKHRVWKCLSITIIIISDVFYNVFHFYGYDTPTISWGAHVFGALMGFLVGLLIYSNTLENKTTVKAIFYTSLLLLCSLFTILIGLDFHINKCRLKFQNSKLFICTM